MCKFNEGNLTLDFSSFISAEKFDLLTIHGTKAIDFIVESSKCICLIEVKDFQNPHATEERKKADLEMLTTARTEFCMEMGMKLKDSLLRLYACGIPPKKKIQYLLLINLDDLSAHERGRLKEKISGYIPIGLNGFKFFNGFVEDKPFDVVNARQIQSYSIICTAMDKKKM